ncbi:hypothetical protein CBI33_00005, partial [Rhodococcus erythropolis]
MWMSVSGVRRVVGSLSVFAVAAGFAVVAGVGVAGAAPVTAEFNSSGYKITRTISNAMPSEGDVITSTTVFKRTDFLVNYLYAVRDFHSPCMTYVEGSAKVNGNTYSPETPVSADSVRVSASITDWPLYQNNTKSFEFQYRVGAGCERGTDLVSTVHFDGSAWVNDTTNGRGPSINVQKNVSTTAESPVSGAQVGQPVTLSATVTGGADGDSVEFFDGRFQDRCGRARQWCWQHLPGHRPPVEITPITAKFADTARA